PICEQPPDVDFGEIISGEKSQYVESDSVQCGCYPGYTLAGSERITCYGRNWMPPPKCLATGKKCGRPPDVANGDITTFSQKEYASGFSVEYKCQKFYSVKGQNKSFCNNGNWTETPICEEPCVISQEEMQNCGIELTETYYGKQYVQHDDFVVFKCKSGHVPLAFLSPDFTVWCHSGNIVYPQCNK
ncbi:unnamed protein product, partial [Eretmochelys imbricata]